MKGENEPMSQNDMNTVENQHTGNVWQYNGYEFELDITDADDAARFEEAMQQLDAAEKSLKKDGTLSERIVAYDKMFRDLYDFLFGSGAGDDILGEKRSMTNCQNSYESLLDYINQQSVTMSERQAALVDRYSGNRAQRRMEMRRR